MIDDKDGSSSVLRLLVWQALKIYPTPSLLTLLEDEDVIVRTAVARELQIRSEKESFSRIASLCDDPRDYMREIAAFVLGQFGTPDLPDRERSIEKLMRLLTEDEASDVRAAAASALGHLGAAQAADALLHAAEDSSSEVRASAAVALGSVGGIPKVLEALRRLLVDPDANVRECAEFGIELASSENGGGG